MYALFSQYGRILDVVALKTTKLRGQAWVVFSEVTAASNAVRQMQNFPFYEKPMVSFITFIKTINNKRIINQFIDTTQRIQYAKGKSDCIAKADNTFVPKDKRRKQEEKSKLKNDIFALLLIN